MIALLVSLVVYIKSFYKIQFVWDIVVIKRLIKTGLLLLVNSLVWTFMMSIDKFVILGFMDYEALGIYSAALIGFSTLVMIPQSLSSIFYVKLSHQYGSNNDTTTLVKTINKYTCIMSLVVSVVSIVAYYLLPPFILFAMPAYEHGIRSAQLLVMGVSIYSASMLFGHLFTIQRKNIKLLRNTLMLCIFNICFSSGLVIIFGRNINYVALGTTISYGLYGILLCYSMKKESKCGFFECAYNSIFPVCISIGIIQLSDALDMMWLCKVILALFVFSIMSLVLFKKNIISVLKFTD